MKPICQFLDKNKTRYRLIRVNASDRVLNWIFVPGGPGADSIYFKDLIEVLELPGNFWLIDFPENGENRHSNETYDFEKWDSCFQDCIKTFENPIYVGHSFSGMFPLLFKELEHLLEGFIILNSTPCLWFEEAQKCAKENKLPSFELSLDDFRNNPNPSTFKAALLACSPYYFTEDFLEKGKILLDSLPFNYFAAAWWQNKAIEINFEAKWIPQKVPTLILGSSHDFITPFSLFEKAKQFHRQNITLKKIEGAGHFPWIEKKHEVIEAFESFFVCLRQHTNNACKTTQSARIYW